MTNMIVKNRSSKISPGGIVTLPLSARRTLRMERGKGCRVTVATEQDGISVRPTCDQAGVRVSPKGQMELIGEPRALLENALLRHYWLVLDDEKQTVLLRPYCKE